MNRPHIHSRVYLLAKQTRIDNISLQHKVSYKLIMTTRYNLCRGNGALAKKA